MKRALKSPITDSLVVCLALALSGSSARMLGQTVRPHLAPGESVSGREHPEYFSRRVAFQTMLDLLSVQQEDAIHLQRRARLIETKRIGLNLSDIAALEQIVERYRVEERNRKAQAAALAQSGATSYSFTSLSVSHFNALGEAATAINLELSSTGRQQINAFVDDIIAHSEMHGSSPKQKGGGL